MLKLGLANNIRLLIFLISISRITQAYIQLNTADNQEILIHNENNCPQGVIRLKQPTEVNCACVNGMYNLFGGDNCTTKPLLTLAGAHHCFNTEQFSGKINRIEYLSEINKPALTILDKKTNYVRARYTRNTEYPLFRKNDTIIAIQKWTLITRDGQHFCLEAPSRKYCLYNNIPKFIALSRGCFGNGKVLLKPDYCEDIHTPNHFADACQSAAKYHKIQKRETILPIEDTESRDEFQDWTHDIEKRQTEDTSSTTPEPEPNAAADPVAPVAAARPVASGRALNTTATNTTAPASSPATAGNTTAPAAVPTSGNTTAGTNTIAGTNTTAGTNATAGPITSIILPVKLVAPPPAPELDEDFFVPKALDSEIVKAQLFNYLQDKGASILNLGSRPGEIKQYRTPAYQILNLAKEVIKKTCPSFYVNLEHWDMAVAAFISMQQKAFRFRENTVQLQELVRITSALKQCANSSDAWPFLDPKNASCVNGTTEKIEPGSYFKFNTLFNSTDYTYEFSSRHTEPIIETVWKIFVHVHAKCYHFFMDTRYNDHHRFTTILLPLFSNDAFDTWTKDTNGSEYKLEKRAYGGLLGNAHELMDNVDYCAVSGILDSEYPWDLPRPTKKQILPPNYRRKREVSLDNEFGVCAELGTGADLC